MKDYNKIINDLINDSNKLCDNLEKDYKRNNHYISVLENTKDILDDLDLEFQRKTGLTEADIGILFIATGLQIIRQLYFTASMIRKPDRIAANETLGHHSGHSDRYHALYNPTLEQIRNNPVPFDLNYKSNGKLSGGGQLGHRSKTLGHDPLLGLIFGTANIATSTVTLNDFTSYHVKTGITKANKAIDCFYRRASTYRVLDETKNKLLDVKGEGIAKVCLSMYYEIVHLQSDLMTTNSLPLPIVSTFNPKIASFLATNGLDMFNVVKYSRYVASAEFAIMINKLVAIFHGLFFDGKTEMDYKLYCVRTKKIINYSNIISSMTNLFRVYLSKDVSKLDIGGIAVCVYQVINNKKFIRDVKHEFIFGQYKDIFLDTSSEFEITV